MLRAIMFRLRCSILIPVILSLAAGSTSGSTVKNRRITKAASVVCASNDEIAAIVQKLSTPLRDPEVTRFRKVLLGNARRSPACRKRVIAALMGAMDKPNLDLLRDEGSNDLWSIGAGLLGELKAVEALDLLITHLKISDHLAALMSHYPAVSGVIEMGPMAIPKLAGVLRENSNRDMRRFAVYSMGQIGGASARRALRQALPAESDPCVCNFIRATINAFNNKKSPDHFASNKAYLEWYEAFYCKQ